MGKPRTSLSPSDYCANCESSFAPKDSAIHEQSCPPSDKKWSHSYIRGGVIHSTLECYTSQVQPQHISEQETDNMIFVSLPAMTVCNIAIGDPVVIDAANGVKIVKTAWPTNDKTLTSVSMTRKAMDSSRAEGLIKVRKLSSEPQMAREIEIKYTGKQQTLPKTTAELEVMIKNRNELNIFVPGNRITVPYYGKNLNFEIVRINDDRKQVAPKVQEQDLSEKFNEISISEEKSGAETERFYKALYCTKWRVMFGTEETKSLNTETNMTIDDIGGYETVISELRDFLDVALGKWRKIAGFKVAKGVLLYGTAGVGKSMIANAVLSEYSARIFALDSSDFQKKIAGETETRLGKILEEAKSEAPSVIFIEDIDVLCPRKSNSTADNDKRSGYSALVKLLDEIRLYDANIAVLATTSRPDYIDSSLRRPGRLDKELEVCAPTPAMRKEIIRKFLAKVPNRLTDDDVDVIASTTHGFVGADLYGLCSDSALRSMKRYHEKETSGRGTFAENRKDITIELRDFNEALKSAKPSAMKEVVVEVPNVKWSEIGGQEGLKLKLKQAVEWPLRHPEAFTRLGISPPRGLLMFGPPGCSKTMIAKALATESKLNFLNIKGPELFSKWVGDSERAVRQVFRKARQVAPSIIFIDEIDALGSERGSASNGSGGSNVQERVLAQLLTELDGVTALGNVTLVAATNRPDRIDKALLRPGRLDRIVYVPLPDAETRREIFTIKFQKMPQAEDVIIQDLVDLTEGYSGAEVQAICHEAAMKALEENLHANIITKEHFKAALSIVTPRTPASLIKMYDDYINNYK